MSNIVLSSAVRQNLLALQNTAALLATTQNDLSTGKKVNSALDNPTNYFTASGLDNRAGDISNLLDGISNGVQVLQAANTGITSLQSLVSQAQSIANQALQSSIGYSTKANVATTVPGATSSNLLGTGYTAGTFTTAALAQAGSSAATKISSTSHLDSTGSATDYLAASAGNLVVNGETITLAAGAGASTISSTGSTIHLDTGTVGDVVSAINAIAGAGVASVDATTGKLSISTGTAGSGISISGTAATLASLGLSSGGTATGTQVDSTFTGFAATGSTLAAAASPQGETLIIPVTDNGTSTTATITFGTGAGQISTLNALNTALASDNLQATITTAGVLTISTSNDAASGTIGTISGTAASSTFTGSPFNPATATGYALTSSPVLDATSQTTRANLVSQYNAILTQITNTAQDSSYNGINLLAGDQLQLTFNETGKSKVNITGVDFSAAGLGLSSLTAGTAFIDNNQTNKVLSTLTSVSSELRSQASAFGSNLSVVQTRQDFNKNLINVLQTGSANLTQADINEEAANSQALSTRQSLSVSALSLANQSQQSVLQLLR